MLAEIFDWVTYIEVVTGVYNWVNGIGSDITWALELPERLQGYLSMWRQRACRCV